jgi:hypothetical protein
MIGLFLFGCFITGIVAAACLMIVTGIREDKRARERLSADRGEDVKLRI